MFDESNPVHAAVWELVDTSDSYLLESDTTSNGKDYNCFVSAPVRAGGISFGMLTANTLETQGLSREDADNMVVMARMLATAEGLALATNERRSIIQVSESRGTMQGDGSSA